MKKMEFRKTKGTLLYKTFDFVYYEPILGPQVLKIVKIYKAVFINKKAPPGGQKMNFGKKRPRQFDGLAKILLETKNGIICSKDKARAAK